MHWLKCNLLAIILCAAFWQDSAAQTESHVRAAETVITVNPKENEVNFHRKDSTKFFATEKITLNLTDNLTQGNSTAEQNNKNLTSSNKDVQISLNQKQEVENITFNDIKPFLLFPILPFFFPPKGDESLNSGKNEFSISKNNTSKVDGNPADGKPFIFSSFSFIRRIPLNNKTKSSNDSKIINVKRLSFSESDDLKTDSKKTRKRRNSNKKMDTHGFFDDSPLFPDFELDEFLPKPDLFFPDLPFHHKPLKKLSRRKRDQKKPDFKNDLKFFFDAFDEAFMQTERELEHADPILNFLRGGSAFEKKKEENNFLNQEKPRIKWKIQRNIKRLNNDHQNKLPEDQNNPMIIVDKVVKIGQFHVHDEEDKLKKKKNKDEKEPKAEILKVSSHENDETFPKTIFELIKQEENRRKKRNHSAKSERQAFTKIQSEEIRILPQMNTSFLSVGNNATIEIKKKVKIDSQKNNTTDKSLKYRNFIEVIDSLKTKIKEELTNSAGSAGGRQKRKGSSQSGEVKSIKASYDNLKKNITELLIQFLELAKNLDDAKLVERLEVGEHNDAGVFDWTEKETLQGINTLGKNFREKRQKKDPDFEDEYIDMGKKERQFADLNYLFLTVTLPTVFIFAMALLVCFFSLQVKGKICSKLFRPRQVFIVEDENSVRFNSSIGSKPQSKVQAI